MHSFSLIFLRHALCLKCCVPGSRTLGYRVRLMTSVPAYILLVLSLPLHPLLLGFLLGIALAAVIVAKAWMEIGRKTWLSTFNFLSRA